MSSSPIKVGLIGYGFSTKCFHAPFITPNPDLEIYAFLQRSDPPGKQPWGHCTIDFPKAKHYKTSEEFFGDSEIELVIVCSHGDTHVKFASEALNAGKHVVVEKAFTRTSEEADYLVKLAKEKKRILTVFQNRRFDSDFMTLQQLISKDALGDIREAEIHYDVESPSWIQGWTKKEYSPGEGMTFGLGSHTIDQALLLFGPPTSVTGFLRANRGVDSEIDDTFTIILQYGGEKKNLLVTIKTAIITPMQDQLKYFIRGTKGSYIKVGEDPQIEHLLTPQPQHGTCIQEPQAIEHMPATDPKFGVEEERLWGTLTTTEEFDGKSQKKDEASGKWIGKYPTLKGNYLGYYENVAQAIRGKVEIAVKPEESRDGLRVIELAHESSSKGVTMPWS